jgi:hypothetical protein
VISNYIIIRDQTILHNGKVVFDDDLKLTEFLEKAYSTLNIDYPKFYKMDNLSKLGFLGTELLLKDNPLKAYKAEEVAVVLSNAHASLDTDIRYAESAKGMGSPALFVYTLANIVAGEICIRHKLKGENAFFVSPNFDAELISCYVDMVLSSKNGTKACIAGWVDVLGEHHDVFLYLMEKDKNTSVEHSADNLKALYNS